MQTFLPYASFTASAKVLDRARLGKQRVEVLQLLKSIKNVEDGISIKGWVNHPCRKMWQHHSNALVSYGLAICLEWVKRGYKDTCFDKIDSYYQSTKTVDLPSFIGDNKFHNSHKSNLLRKDKDYYSKYWQDISDNVDYIWPDENTFNKIT